MADILFVYNDRSAHSQYSTGLGVAAVSAYLKRHGLTSELIYYKTDLPPDAVCERVRRADPMAVGYYGPSSGFWAIRRISEVIRQAFPQVFQVYGGPQATLQPEVIASAPALDAVCVGLGELSTLHLLQRLSAGRDVTDLPGFWVASREDGERVISANPPRGLPDEVDELLNYDYPLFLRELEKFRDFDKARYSLEVVLSRNCPFNCAFCSNRALRKIQGNREFRPSVSASIDMLKGALTDTGLRSIEFHDEILTRDKDWFNEFIGRYADEIATPFACNLRAGTFDEDDVRALKQAGVKRVFLGLESGNDRIRNAVMNKGITRQELEDSFGWFHAHGVPAVTQNMIGLPSETPGAFLDTIRMNARLRPEYSILSVFYPYPGTELEELCRVEGLIAAEEKPDMLERMDTMLALPGFSRREIIFYQEHFAQFVRYERLRRGRLGRVLPPLTVRTAKPLGALFHAREVLA